MRKNALTRAVLRYLATTTLHGFKYLRVPKYADRTVWVAWCVASAGCAGALCLVLWARFTQVPTVLSLRPVQAAAVLPSLALCVPAPLLARRVVGALNVPDDHSLTMALTKLLLGLPAPSQQMSQLETALQQRHQTLKQLLLRVTPPCDEVSVRCQVDSHPIKCEKIVHRDVTIHGACCVLRPSDRRPKNEEVFYTKIKSMAIVLNCSDEDIVEYDFLIHHEGKGWLKSTVISPGYTYYGPLTFKSVLGDTERVIESTCISDEYYSQTACQMECVERACGCEDPMQNDEDNDYDINNLPFCSLEQLACLRSHILDSKSCNCYPSCKQTWTNMSLKQISMYGLKYNVVDPLYKGLNPNKSAVLKLEIEQTGSYVFARIPTESWLTLLSSLGGVFNMFLGVGLFSALELIYFMFISIPLAIRKSTRIEISSAVVPRDSGRKY